MPTRDEWFDAQEDAVAALRAPGPANLTRAARRLAVTLTDIVNDGPMWSRFEQRTAAADRTRLELVVSQDWKALLTAVAYEPPPDAVIVAMELTDAARKAARTGSAVDCKDLREKIHWLAERLHGDADQTSGSEQQSRLRDLIGLGLSTLGRMRLLKVSTETGVELSKRGVSAGFVAAVGDNPSYWAAIGDVVAAFAVSGVQETVRALREARHHKRTSVLRTVAEYPALQPAWMLDVRVKLGVVESLEPPTLLGHLTGLEENLAETTANLAILSDQLLAHGGPAGIDQLRRLRDLLHQARRYLLAIPKAAAMHNPVHWTATIRAAQASTDDLSRALQDLQSLVRLVAEYPTVSQPQDQRPAQARSPD